MLKRNTAHTLTPSSTLINLGKKSQITECTTQHNQKEQVSEGSFLDMMPNNRIRQANLDYENSSSAKKNRRKKYLNVTIERDPAFNRVKQAFPTREKKSFSLNFCQDINVQQSQNFYSGLEQVTQDRGDIKVVRVGRNQNSRKPEMKMTCENVRRQFASLTSPDSPIVKLTKLRA